MLIEKKSSSSIVFHVHFHPADFSFTKGSKIMGGDGGGTGLVSPTSEVAQALDGEVEVSLAAITCGGGSGTKGQ